MLRSHLTSSLIKHRWFSLSLCIPLLYAITPLLAAFRGDFVIDSDARQHVFWMARFLDSGLFPNDWIADYHQFVAPWGYTQVYRLAAIVGLDPITFNKLLPPILATITTAYLFRVCRAIGTSQPAAALATLLLNQTLWMRYDIVTGTARSFLYPLFAAFLFYFVRASRIGVAMTIVLQGLFYPQFALLSCAVLLVSWLRSVINFNRPQTSQKSQPTPPRWHILQYRHSQLTGFGLIAGFLVLLPYALRSSPFDPAISANQARQMLEFLPGGRVDFFHTNPLEFFLYGKRSGLLPKLTRISPWLGLGAVLPIALGWQRWRGSSLTLDIDRVKLSLLADVAIASVGMFALAHLTLFRIHHPSRYTMHSLLIVLAIAAAVWLTPALRRVGQALRRRVGRPGAITILAVLIVLWPAIDPAYHFKYKQGQAPQLYTFLQAQPRDTMTATLSKLGNDIPSHAQRPVLASAMFAMPYHQGYYRELQTRIEATIAGQYATEPPPLMAAIARYDIDFWLLDRDAFAPHYRQDAAQAWLQPFTDWTVDAGTDRRPILAQLRDRCSAIEGDTWQLVDTACVIETISSES